MKNRAMDAVGVTIWCVVRNEVKMQPLIDFVVISLPNLIISWHKNISLALLVFFLKFGFSISFMLILFYEVKQNKSQDLK